MANEINEHFCSFTLFVDEFSYLMFDRIGLEEQRMKDWPSLPPTYCFT